MTNDERMTYEAAIQKFNAKGWRESKTAALLFRAGEVIYYYKRLSNELKDNALSPMAERITELHDKNVELRKQIEHLEEQLNPKI